MGVVMPVITKPTVAQVTAIGDGIDPLPDTDLPVNERRGRAPEVLPGGRTPARGDDVVFPLGTGGYLGNGRGRGWVMVAWLEDGNLGYGTFRRRNVR